MGIELYSALKEINRIRRKEIVLPMARTEAVVSPLSVGDDLILKTALISPVKLDKELMYLLWQHTDLWVPNQEEQTEVPTKNIKKKKNQEPDRTGGKYKRLSEHEFYNTISYFDKLVILWGIYNVTYGTLGTQTLKCTNCDKEFEAEVNVESTLHEDSITLWDETKPPFTQYTENIDIPLNADFTLRFAARIPSMSDFNRLLSLISINEIQNNLENLRSEFNTEQLMTLYTKSLSVFPTKEPDKITISDSTQEILSSIRDCINIDVATEFFKEYADRFSQYNVNFYTLDKCPYCGTEIKTPIDYEFQFFRRQLPS